MVSYFEVRQKLIEQYQFSGRLDAWSIHPKKVSGILGQGLNKISGGFAEYPFWNPASDREHFERKVFQP